MAAIIEVISLPILGVSILFPYGLSIGVCAAAINLNIIESTIKRAVDRGKKGPVVIGFFIRMLLFAGAFWLAVRTSNVSGLGAAIGFMLPRITLYFRFGMLPGIRKMLGKDLPVVYRADTRSMVFIKEPWLTLYCGGRSYVTHRHFKKIRVLTESK